ncbi:DMT family transporter [Thaumasiovibrio subtropicus]|uniref:DMT family transporter n=1 Tax=Thaumasiovibrio subtropicus TaxID=1891207 RepID=UPI000B357581|nr:DMT family transporter [Thaumasiovibrio subtropicus]
MHSSKDISMAAVGYMLLSTFSLSVTSVVIKLLGEVLSSDVLNAARFLFPSLILVPLFFARRARFPTSRQWPFILLRGVSLMLSQVCFLYAITHLSFFEAVVLFSTGPLFMAIFDMLLFRAKLSVMTISAILCAFIGVMIQAGGSGQGFAFSIATLIGLGAGLFNSASQLVMHGMVNNRLGPLSLNAWSLFIALLCALPFVNIANVDAVIVLLDWQVTGLLFLMGFTISMTQFNRSKAYQLATSSSLLSPLIFTNLIFAFFWQQVLFDEPMEKQKALGLSVVVVACLMRSMEPWLKSKINELAR